MHTVKYLQLVYVNFELLKCGVVCQRALSFAFKWFIIHISDMCKGLKLLDLILFADDTNSLYTGTNLEKIVNK